MAIMYKVNHTNVKGRVNARDFIIDGRAAGNVKRE
jgi:hypothetical protein